MLINCPECELQVSSKAIGCPHCGYPLVKNVKYHSRPKRRMRLPNGFGQITELKNPKLRKRFRARVCVGKASDGSCICKPLKPETYFATYNEAYVALVEYHKNPYNVESDITVKELYEKWSNDYFKTLKSNSSIRTIQSAWLYCSVVYDMKVKDIRARHIKGCMEDGCVKTDTVTRYPSANLKSRIKSLFNLMLDYAVEYEIVDKNYARTFDISSDIIRESNTVKREHMSFTDDEIAKLWENIHIPYVDVILIQCYGGWRPQELGLIRTCNVNINDWTITGGMKTEAGTNRVVPVHPKIRPIIEDKYQSAVKSGSEYLLPCIDSTTHKGNTLLTYDKYQKRFAKIRDTIGLNPEHRAHDGRKHFVTIAKRYNVDEYAIKYIVGHAILDITEKIYTDRNLCWLQSEISKIQ